MLVCFLLVSRHFAYAREPKIQPIYDYYQARCDIADIPDAPARAFRDNWQRVHVVSSHDQTRQLIGNSFETLRHSCDIIYEGHHSSDPDAFDDRQWLASFVTVDGLTIYALVHNEFQANLRQSLCPSRVYLSCWENSIGFAISANGGQTFVEPKRHVIAALGYAFEKQPGHPVGYFQPTNVVYWQGYYYFMFLAEHFREQLRGYCVARTKTIEDTTSWRAWDGEEFRVSLGGRSSAQRAYKDVAVCTPVGDGSLYEVGSLLFRPADESFLMVTSIPHRLATPGRPAGAYVSCSKNMIHWSKAKPILTEPTDLASPDKFAYGFFSLIDHNSSRRDFSTVEDPKSLYLYFVKATRRDAPYGRVLCRERVLLPDSVCAGIL